MSNYIRIGNTFAIQWTIQFHDGSPISLSNYAVRIFLKTGRGKSEITDFVIEDNTVAWTFKGNMQKLVGSYSLSIIIYDGTKEYATFDWPDAFYLQEKGGEETETVITHVSRIDLLTTILEGVRSLDPDYIRNSVYTVMSYKDRVQMIETQLSKIKAGAGIEIVDGTISNTMRFTDSSFTVVPVWNENEADETKVYLTPNNDNETWTVRAFIDGSWSVISEAYRAGLTYPGFFMKGVIGPNTIIDSPEKSVCYIAATAGIYSRCGGFEVSPGEIALLKYDGESWSKETIHSVPLIEVMSQAEYDALENKDANTMYFTYEDDEDEE